MNRWIVAAALAAAASATVAQGTATPRVDSRESAAARAEARRGTLAVGDPAQWQANALLRCQRHPAGDERAACERMVRGEGTQSGSVEEGGIFRELVTRTVEPAPAASAPQ